MKTTTRVRVRSLACGAARLWWLGYGGVRAQLLTTAAARSVSTGAQRWCGGTRGCERERGGTVRLWARARRHGAAAVARRRRSGMSAEARRGCGCDGAAARRGWLGYGWRIETEKKTNEIRNVRLKRVRSAFHAMTGRGGRMTGCGGGSVRSQSSKVLERPDMSDYA
jgi:hypothetical protein